MGKCPECSSWNSLVEEIDAEPSKGTRSHSPSSNLRPVPITKVSDTSVARIPLPFSELNRVLGGGLTRGSVVLLAGDPGIGKSTLLLQLVGTLAKGRESPLLYISGEESARQIKLRAERLGVLEPKLLLLPETNLVDILTHAENLRPEVIVVDSIQTLYWPELTSIPGSVSQVRETADRLVRFTKQRDITLFLVGHVTKEGTVAGPMTLEHLVDTVLQFEGDHTQTFRMLRAMKNRFGPTDEVGVFEMREEGLIDAANPSELFLRDRPTETPGTVIFPAMEGSRSLLVEVQGLAARTSYGVPTRSCSGFDKNRLTMLLAVLEKRAGLHLSDQDVYVNVVGGLSLDEPAADLPVATAVIGSFLGKPIPTDTVIFGEIGLAGEIRAIARSEARLKEAAKLGFKKAIVPQKLERVTESLVLERLRTVLDVTRLFR